MSQCQIVSCDILLEFLEIAFNGILFNRNLYPKEIFVRKKIYGIAVNISQHPEINQYIKNILETIRELIIYDEKCVKNINLVFYDSKKLIVERYVFHLFDFKFDAKELDPYFLKTEEALRTICLKLSMTNAYLNPLPDDCTFTIEIDTYEAAHIAISENPKCEDFPWITKESTDELNIRNNLLPLTTINTEYLGLQMYVITPDNESKNNV
ncbi:hypothetical protein PV325_011419 [Microctonus aethiopoides]|uniref:HORMA domain-containing protein n=1 Tax=Microctonus aethiopoides TaxID=144406 RepID=A0AA39FBJ2_9HYME|nr:hypothetical protein PV325_011419 [Microctonus aethiopoides]KAK0083191.1 hypothetical protein PV326_006851 [Microctonus aethiopoides]KAK0166381.1 hypothetical protein PV328_004807 [Microctonus aethiopoides]